VSSPNNGYGPAPSEAGADTPVADGADIASSGSLSRREFAKRAGFGSAAAAGLVWAAPRISTIRYAAKAAAGSAPPTSTTNTAPVETLGGKVTVSAASPCVGEQVRVTANGFAPNAGVAIQIDSAAHAIDMVNADASGAVDVLVTIPTNAPTGLRTLRAVGPIPGGTTQILTTEITIKTAAECAAPDGTGVGATGSPVGAGVGAGTGGGTLPLTGSDAIDLAAIGGAAAIGGRVLYGATRRSPTPIDGSDR
jgi:cytochrome c